MNIEASCPLNVTPQADVKTSGVISPNVTFHICEKEDAGVKYA